MRTTGEGMTFSCLWSHYGTMAGEREIAEWRPPSRRAAPGFPAGPISLARMRHDGCGGLAAKAELLTGIEGVSSRPVRRIVLIKAHTGNIHLPKAYIARRQVSNGAGGRVRAVPRCPHGAGVGWAPPPGLLGHAALSRVPGRCYAIAAALGGSLAVQRRRVVARLTAWAADRAVITAAGPSPPSPSPRNP
jgi:hypothetical protein